MLKARVDPVSRSIRSTLDAELYFYAVTVFDTDLTF
jgi:hypothetical protein